jgi:hypothetical protein
VFMITRLGIRPHDYDRPRRETERELLMRRAREHRLEERRTRRRATLRRLTGRGERAA